MTRLCFTSSIKAGRLSLKVSHYLTTQSGERIEDEPTNTIKRIKGSNLKRIQILHPSSRSLIVMEGVVDGSVVSIEQMCNSAVGKHLLKSLRKNSDALCIHDISDITIENGKATISFSSSHPRPPSDGLSSPHLIFLSLKLVYTWRSGLTEKEVLNWKTSLGCDNVPYNPITFSRVLPFVELLDKIGHRLFSHHIIRRYPWIFGPYSQAIRREQVFFAIIAKSLGAIFGRSQDQLLRRSFLAKIKEMRHKNALHDQVTYQFLSQMTTPEHSYIFFNRASVMNDVKSEAVEQAESSNLPVLEQFLTNMYSQGVRPWIKDLRGYSSDSEEDGDSSIPKTDLDENSLEDVCYQDETPELDWSSSETDSIEEFGLTQSSDGYDEDDFLVNFPESASHDACRDLELEMSSDRVVFQARSAGNAAKEEHECLEEVNAAGIKNLPQRPFDTDADPVSKGPNAVQLFLNRAIASDVDGKEPKWSEMDIEDISDGTLDFEFSLESSGNVHSPLDPLLSGGLGGQECIAHVHDLFEYESDSEMVY